MRKKKEDIVDELENFQIKNNKSINDKHTLILNDLNNNIDELMKEFDNISISNNSIDSDNNIEENTNYYNNSQQSLEKLNLDKKNSNFSDYNNDNKDINTEENNVKSFENNIDNKTKQIDINNLRNKYNDNDNDIDMNGTNQINKKILQNNILVPIQNNSNKENFNNTLLNNLFITVNNNSIVYGGKKFLKVKYQGKIKKQTKIYYRCENYRKDSHIRQGNIDKFCQGKITYEIIDDKYYFTKDHSFECYDLTHTKAGNIKSDDNTQEINTEKLNYKKNLLSLINNKLGLTYAQFKKDSIEIYKKEKYQFPYNSNFIHNLFYKNKDISNMFSEQIIYKYKTTKNNIPFLKKILNYFETENHNTGKIKEYKAIIWASDINIAHAKKSNHFYIDSTFIRPIGFHQLLVVLYKDILTSKNYPLSYVIMNNKTEKLYREIFNYLESIININNREIINNITITIDFELAELNAIKNIYPNIRLIGCWFHFKKNIVKNAKKKGLL